jgi:hypothetical protein
LGAAFLNTNKENNKMADGINILEEMINRLECIRTDYAKFYEDGNNAAGTRVRKVMQEIKTDAQDLRLHIQETKNTAS